MRGTGISGFRLDRDIATLVRDDGEYNPAHTVDPRDSATPLAMAQFLAGLYKGRIFFGPLKITFIKHHHFQLISKRHYFGQRGFKFFWRKANPIPMTA